MIIFILAGIILLFGGIYFFISRLLQRINETQEKLLALASIDDLTQLYNRRYFFERFNQEVERSKRYQRPLSCLIMDLDFFKSVNDSFGHLAGDQVLIDIAQIIRKNCRQSDLAGRFGGEELIILLPETGASGAVIIAERIRQMIEQHRTIDGKGNVIGVTVSLGVASLDSTEMRKLENNELIIQRADDALLQAKKNGRNRIELYHPVFH